MALQGDLQSFALPDVLRLLAGTGKTGRLAVESGAGSGDVWLKAGQVVGGSVTSSPHAQSAADVVFELLRFDGGSFAFEDDAEHEAPGEPSDVDAAIVEAQGLLDEWKAVEAVVPSVQSWVALRPEIDGDQTTVTADQWRALAALGGGSSVRDLGNRFELTDLAISRRVKDLVESGLVELGEPRDEAPPAAPPAPPAATPPTDDLAVLRADDGPVVLETRDDALLPEPLPSESTSFEGELTDLSGSVDGRADSAPSDAVATTVPDEPADPAPVADGAETDRASYEAFVGAGEPAEEADAPVEAAPVEAAAEDAPPADALGEPDEAEEQAWTTFANGDTMVDHLAEDAEAEEAGADAAPAADSDRGSLLKFLSTVKN